MPIDNKPTGGLKSFCARARAFREREVMDVHRKNLMRSAKRAEEQWLKHDVHMRWAESPVLLKTRAPRPKSAVVSAVSLAQHAHIMERADEKVRPQSNMAKRLGGCEDLVCDLGGDTTPLGRLRPPTGPPSVLSRVESVERMRDAALVRHGYTHRERAVLWGTSLQQYEALHLGLNTDLDSPSLVGQGSGGRRPRQRAGKGAAEDGGKGGGAGVGDDRGERGYKYAETNKLYRKQVLDALCADARHRTQQGVLLLVNAAWKRAVSAAAADSTLLRTLCCLMRDLNLERATIDAFYDTNITKKERERDAARRQKDQDEADRDKRKGVA